MADGQETKKDGGSEWELSEAIKLMGEAQASGDPEQIATAMRRHAEALTNVTNTVMIPTLQRVLETVVKTEVGKITKQNEANAFAQQQITSTWLKDESERRETQIKAFITELNALPAIVQEAMAAELGKITPRIEDIEAGLADIKGIVSDHGEEIGTIKERLVEVEQTPGTSPDLARRITYLSYAVGLLAFVWVLIVIATVLQ